MSVYGTDTNDLTLEVFLDNPSDRIDLAKSLVFCRPLDTGGPDLPWPYLEASNVHTINTL